MSVMYENRLFSACFIVWMYRYTTFEIKVDLCAHTYGKIGTFTAGYILATFWLDTPYPYSAGWRWGLLSRKIFLIFIFQILARIHRMSGLRIFFYFLVSPILFLLVFYFFYFFLIFVWILVSTLFFRLSYLIISTRLKFVILYSILFFGLSIVSTRYKLSLDIHHLFRFIFITFGFLDFRH